jgi:predicted ATPase/DNA-binding winged helix-turn-helix (wHTH) protein
VPTLYFGPFRLLSEQRQLLDDGKVVRLGARAFDTLLLLVQRAGEVVTKDEIAGKVWPDSIVDETSIRVHICALRRVLGDGHRGARYITNVTGRGYCFVATVGEVPETPCIQEVLLAPDRGAPIPSTLSRTIGREHIITEVAARLESQRLVTVVGPGGIGKTTVALGVAGRLAKQFDDGIYFVDLAPLADSTLVESTLAIALGITSAPLKPMRDLIEYLRRKRILIVLDNCEHVVAATAALVEQILNTTSDVRLLATSRERLRANNEWTYRLPQLEVPEKEVLLSVRDALCFSAIELFVERATASTDGFVLSDKDVPGVAQICRKLDGIPLAIELAAANVGTLGVDTLARLLDASFSLLNRSRRTALTRHRTLKATFDWSYSTLTSGEQALLRCLGIFAGSFTLPAVHALLRESETRGLTALRDLCSLIDKSLVVVDASADMMWYRLLDSTRTYAMEKLVSGGELAVIARRHAEYFCRLLNNFDDEISTPDEDWSPRHLDNVRKALDWSTSPEGDPEIGLALTLAAVPLWTELTLMSECEYRVRRAYLMRLPPATNRVPQETDLNLALGLALIWTNGPRVEAREALERALELALSIDDVDRLSQIYCALHLYYGSSAETGAALSIAKTFYSVAQSARNPSVRPIAEYALGNSLHFKGQQRLAQTHLERAIQGYDTRSRTAYTRRLSMDRLTSARTIHSWTLWLLGFPDQARIEAARAVEDANHVLSRCHALADGAGAIALLTCDLEQLEFWAGALNTVAEKHVLRGKREYVVILKSAGSVRRGMTLTQLEVLRTAMQETGAIVGFRHRRAMLLGILAEGLAAAGKVDDARDVLAEALAQGESGDADWCLAELLRIAGELALLEESPRAADFAEHRFQQALETARKQDALSWELRAAMSLGRLWLARGKASKAHELLAFVYGRFSEGFETDDLRAARMLLTRLANPGCYANERRSTSA